MEAAFSMLFISKEVCLDGLDGMLAVYLKTFRQDYWPKRSANIP